MMADYIKLLYIEVPTFLSLWILGGGGHNHKMAAKRDGANHNDCSRRHSQLQNIVD